VFVAVRAHQDVDTVGRAGRNPTQGIGGDEVPVDDRLPQHPADRDLFAPPFRISIRIEPPKAAMLSRTQIRAAIWSRRPLFAHSSPVYRKSGP
jgi:hypothetical protein